MRIFRYIKDHIPAFLAVLVFLIIQAFCDLALPNFTADILDSIVSLQAVLAQGGDSAAASAQQIDFLWVTAAKMLGVTLVGVLAAIAVGFIASRVAAEIARSLREKVFSKVLSFASDEMDRFQTASLITRSTNDIQQIQMVYTMLLRMVLYAPIMGIGGVIMIMGTNMSMAWIIGLAVLVIIGIVAVLFSTTMPKFKLMQKLIDRMNLVSREILTGIPVIRAFGREDIEEKRFDAASRDLMRTQLFTNRAMSIMMPLMTLVLNGVSVLIVWTAAHQISLGAMQVGDLVAFITYAMMIIMSFLMLSMVSIMLPRASVAADRVDEVLSTEASITDPEKPLALPASPGGHSVSFDHVSFSYEGAEDEVLRDVDFTAAAGQTTAIIGATGCGKSTLINLIPRFHDVTVGAVRVDGVDVRDLPQHELRGLLGYVPQKAVLFSGTIAENIAFGAPGLSREGIERAAAIAQASDFIASEPEGYDTFIAQGGTNVSGGQKQRLSIARALATAAPILLFDDSFSALDYKTDTALRRALHTQLGGSTVIIVAQRIATVLSADKIVVLDDGAVAGIGTHDELMENCEAYREIAFSQLSATELEGGAA